MTAITQDQIATVPAASNRFSGLRVLVRKDIVEWIRGRRAVVVFVASTLVMLLAAANAWILTRLAAALPPDVDPPNLPESLAPLDNFGAAVGTQIFIVGAIFAVASLLARERESGTLAWVASKPVSREAIWLSKLISAATMLALAGVLAPFAVTVAAVVAMYGVPDPGSIALVAFGAVAVVVVYAAVGLAAATFVPGQPAVAATGFVVFALVPVAASLIPFPVGPYLPTSILQWSIGAAMGAPVGLTTPIAWAVGIVALSGLAIARMRRLEL
jgi:ABC-2 type transport system permease protein